MHRVKFTLRPIYTPAIMIKFIVLVAAVAVLICQAEAAPKAAKIPDCAKIDFSNLDKKCCKKPISDIALPATIEKCNPKNKNKDMIKWINDYMLFKLQNVKKNNSVDLTSANSLKSVCVMAPFLNCIFNVTGIMTANGTIDSAVVKTLLGNNMKDEDWKRMLETIATGVEYRDYIPPMFRSGVPCPTSTKKGAPTTNVSVEALILVQYLQLTIVSLCPEFTDVTKTNKCDVNMDTFFTCQAMMWETMFPEESIAKFSDNSSPFNQWFKNPKKAAQDFKKQMLLSKSG